MKYLITILSFLSFLTSCNSQDTYPVPNWKWIDIEAKEITVRGITTITTNLSRYEDTCGISSEGTITKLKAFSKDESLVIYRTSYGGGTECDNGIIFIISNKELYTYRGAAKAKLDKANKRKRKIESLLNEIY